MTTLDSAQSIPPILTPEWSNAVMPAELEHIKDWLRTNAVRCIEQSRMKGTRDLRVDPKPGKSTTDPINDYTGIAYLNAVSIDVVDQSDPNFHCTHGVVLPTTKLQNFGTLGRSESIILRQGDMFFRISQIIDRRKKVLAQNFLKPGSILSVQAGQILFLLQQLTLHIHSLRWRHEIPPRLPTRSHESSAR